MTTRKQIRQKVVELLMGNTDCGTSVFSNRTRPFIDVDGWQSELPAIVVYTNDESSTRTEDAPPRWERVARIVVEVHQAGDSENPDDFLDDVAQQVEGLVGSYPWHLEEIWFELGDTRILVVETQSQRINGALAVTFQMTYYSHLPDAAQAAALEDFNTSAHTFRVGQSETEQTVILR